MEQTKERLYPISSLYLLKGIAAFLVVACHTPMGSLGRNLEPIKIIAVPLFFLISGYMIYREGSNKGDLDEIKSRLYKSFIKIIRLVLITNLFYYFWLFPKNGNVIHSFSQLLECILLGNQFTGHLWYLTAFAEALMMFYFLFFIFKTDRFMFFLPPLIITNLLIGRYGFLSGEFIDNLNLYNLICYALPYLSIGYLIKKYERSILSKSYYTWLILLFTLLSYVEFYGLASILGENKEGVFFFSTPLLVSIFITFLKNKTFGKGLIITRWGEIHSGNVYYFHMAIATVVSVLMNKIGLIALYQELGSVFVFFSSIAFSAFLLFVQSKIRIKPLLS